MDSDSNNNKNEWSNEFRHEFNNLQQQSLELPEATTISFLFPTLPNNPILDLLNAFGQPTLKVPTTNSPSLFIRPADPFGLNYDNGLMMSKIPLPDLQQTPILGVCTPPLKLAGLMDCLDEEENSLFNLSINSNNTALMTNSPQKCTFDDKKEDCKLVLKFTN